MHRRRSGAEELQAKGWKRQFVACEPRLSEAVDMYREAGFHVHLEPLPKEPQCDSCADGTEEGECRICFEGVEDRYRIIFTRPASEGIHRDDELL